MAVSIDGYLIDLFEKEDHNYEVDITDHPVEQGADITDHAIEKPGEFELMGIVSDTPIGTVAQDPSRQTEVLPSQDAYQRLLAIKSARRTVSITTSLGTFPKVLLKKLGVPREAKNFKGLVFNVIFREVRIVANKRTSVSVPSVPSVPNAGGQANLGHKESKLWADRYKIGEGAIFVVRRKEFEKAIYIKSFNEQPTPVLSVIDANGVKRPDTSGDSYFEVVGATIPDGFVKDLTYHSFNPTGATSSSAKASSGKLTFNVGEHPLFYGFADHTWHDSTGASVTKTMAPDATPEGFTPEQWRNRVRDTPGSDKGPNLPSL